MVGPLSRLATISILEPHSNLTANLMLAPAGIVTGASSTISFSSPDSKLLWSSTPVLTTLPLTYTRAVTL